MPQAANVISIEDLANFRASLDEYGEEAKEGLCANEMEIQRTLGWLQDQGNHWQRELRVRHEEMVVAKNNLSRRKMIKFMGRPPDCTEQEQALDLAKKRVREAEDKLANVRRWVPLLRRAVDEYEGHARGLASLLEADLPRVSALLERKIASLDAYVNLVAPTSPVLELANNPQSVALAEPPVAAPAEPCEAPPPATPGDV